MFDPPYRIPGQNPRGRPSVGVRRRYGVLSGKSVTASVSRETRVDASDGEGSFAGTPRKSESESFSDGRRARGKIIPFRAAVGARVYEPSASRRLNVRENGGLSRVKGRWAGGSSPHRSSGVAPRRRPSAVSRASTVAGGRFVGQMTAFAVRRATRYKI